MRIYFCNRTIVSSNIYERKRIAAVIFRFYSNNATVCRRTVIKTQHGRQVYLEIRLQQTVCDIVNYFYYDRNQTKSGAQRYAARPLLLKTLHIAYNASRGSLTQKLIAICEAELDKHFYGVQWQAEPGTKELSLDEYIAHKKNQSEQRHRFLIFSGNGALTDSGLPSLLKTRLKNRIHRSIYLELHYYKDGRGCMTACHYYDRSYKVHQDVTPPSLFSCFYSYDRKHIIQLVNEELDCDFNYLIAEPTLDVDGCNWPACGRL